VVAELLSRSMRRGEYVPVHEKSGGYDLANGPTWNNPKAFTGVPSSPPVRVQISARRAGEKK
jgi:hypothetical protein